MLVLRLASIAAALSLGACAAPFHKPLTAENKQRIRSVDVQVIVPQETFMLSAKAPGVALAMGGGLIGAMIDSSIQKSRQADMSSEIRSTIGQLARVDFRREADAALQGAVQAPASGNGLPFTVQSAKVLATTPGKAESERLLAATTDGPAVLLLLVQYALEPGLSAFTTRTSALLRQDGKTETSFQSAAIYQMPLPTGSRDAVLAQLSANDGQLLRSYMQESVNETLRMVALDWTTPPTTGQSASGNLKAHRFNQYGTVVELPATTVAAAGNRTVVRNKTGTLFSLQTESK